MISLLLAIIYIAFISLGLPDSLLGAAWPSIYPELGVPVSASGIVFFIIALGTVISSLNSDRLTKLLGTGKVTAISVGMTAVALFGFSVSGSFPLICLWAVPYGLGAGSIDAALNNYVALHYASRHMSWLHCMWGVGTMIGPYIMSRAIAGGSWQNGYRTISLMQAVLTVILVISLPLWKKVSGNKTAEGSEKSSDRPIPLKEIIRFPGARPVMLCFFCYCGIEQTMNLWISSYLVSERGADNITAAEYASLFFIGITVGRAASGFLTMKLSDTNMIRLGAGILLAGVVMLMIPATGIFTIIGIIVIGLGCAPIYPSIIHSTPYYFGADKSQAVIGVQMASAYVGTLSLPPVFGWMSETTGMAVMPVFLLILLAVMTIMHEILYRNKIGGRSV